MKLTKILQFGGVAALLAINAGCGLQQTFNTQADIDQAGRTASATPIVSRPFVVVHEGSLLLGEKIAATKQQPEIFDKPVLFRSKGGATLNDIRTFIAENIHVKAIIDPSVSETTTGAVAAGGGAIAMPARAILPGQISVPQVQSLGQGVSRDGGASPSSHQLQYFVGKFDDFLDVVDARFGVWSRYQDGQVTFFRTETRTFQIPVIADSSTMTGSISTDSGTSSGGGGTAASTSTAGGSGGGSAGSSGQSINMTLTSNPLNTIQATANAIAGCEKCVLVDKELQVMTVTATPPQCDRLDAWVKNLYAMFGKQIGIDVAVYQIQKTEEHNYGVNLTLAYKNSTGHTGLNIAGATAPTVTGTSGATPMSIGASILSGPLTGSSAAVQALSTLGNVSQLVSRSGVTQNGKVLALQAATQQGYVASTQSTQTASVGSSVTMQTGTLVPGFTSSFLPKVIDGRIMIDFDMTLSDLLKLTTFSGGSGTSESSVQLPTLQLTRLQQSISLRPGQSLVLTGMRQQNLTTTNNGVGSPYMALLGGGVDATNNDTLIAVVITARLL